jgi:hypothetical protein
MMKKQYLRILMAVVGFAGLGFTANAEVIDQIVLTIPFEFVVAGKTLPAGTYKVNRLSADSSEGLVLSSFENNTGAILHVSHVEISHVDKSEVSFENAGDQHFLSKIETANHIFTIPVSSVAIQEAAARSHTGATTGLSSVSK